MIVKALKNVLCLLLTAVLFASILPTLTADAAGAGAVSVSAARFKPGKKDMEGCDSRVQAPKSGSWLKDYEYKVVKGTKKGSKAIYLRLRPEKDGAARGGGNHLGVLYNGTEVTVLARQDGYSLVKVKAGHVGWVISNGLVDKKGAPASAPEGESDTQEFTPSTAPRLSGKPGKKDMEGCDSRVQAPKSGSWLKNYEYMIVQGSKPTFTAIYLRLRPEKDGAARGGGNHLNVLYNGTEVAVLARQDGYSLVLVEPGYVGWVISSGLVSK